MSEPWVMMGPGQHAGSEVVHVEEDDERALAEAKAEHELLDTSRISHGWTDSPRALSSATSEVSSCPDGEEDPLKSDVEPPAQPGPPGLPASIPPHYSIASDAERRSPEAAVAKAPRLAQDALEVALAEQCALAALAPPKCVCGGLLERLSNDERVRRVFRRHLPHVEDGTPQFELFVARLLDEGISVCSCDLCFTEIKPPGKVWTCENGSRTILHANAYDVCEACFLRHAGCQATAGPQLA